MIATDQAALLMNHGEVVSSDGESIGKVGQVYVDNENGQLTWVTVKTGWFGASESFVPLDSATLDGHTITVPYEKATVKDAPSHDTDASLSVDDENDLYSYYGVDHGTAAVTSSDVPVPAALETTGYADTGTEVTVPSTQATSTDGFITRSEEQLHVGTRSVEAGRARLKKFVVTEQQTVTVPVSHDEVHLIRESLAPGDVTDATIGEDAVEVTLMEDKVVVDKETVAVERVKLGTETITEQQAVTEAVRKEQIEMSTDGVDTVTGQFAGSTDQATDPIATRGDTAETLVDKAKNALK